MKHLSSWPRLLKVTCKRAWRSHPHCTPLAILLAVIAVMGVTSRFQTQALKTSWSNSSWLKTIYLSDRTPASDLTCGGMQTNLTEIQLENEQLVKRFPKSHSLRGKWLHLDLQKLSFPEALLLSRWPESSVQSQAAALSHCASIPCLYDQLSQDSEQTVGALSWNWFLKTGIAPLWNEANAYFSKAELQEMWQLSHTLSNDFFHQSELMALEKVELPEGRCFKAENKKIRLSSACAADKLRLELTTAMSELLLPEWIKRFPEIERMLVSQTSGYWDSQKFHQSNFDPRPLAPHVARFILEDSAPDRWKSFFKDQLFRRDWSLKSEMQRQFKKDQWVWRDLKNAHLKDCTDLHKSALVNKTSQRSIASLASPHPLAECVRQGAIQDFNKILKANVNNFDCRWHQPLSQGQVPSHEYLSLWQTLITKDVDQLEWRIRAGGVNWLHDNQAKEKVLAALDPTWIYLECHNADNPKGCYSQHFGSYLKSDDRSPASVKEELLEEYPYESLEAKVSQDVGMKREWHRHRMQQEAQRAWRQCWREGPNEMVKVKSLQWVSGGVEFLDGRFANCLEASSEKFMNTIFPEGPEGQFWRKDLSRELKKIWVSMIATEAENERNWLVQRLDTIKHSLAQDLKRLMAKGVDFDPKQSCLTRLTFHYPARLYFHDRTQLNGYLGKRLCKEVIESEEMSKALTQHRNERWKVLGGALQTSVKPVWEERVRRFCLGRVPASEISHLLTTDPVKGCIREQFELSWTEATETVGSQFSLNPEGLDEFKSDVEIITNALLVSDLKR